MMVDFVSLFAQNETNPKLPKRCTRILSACRFSAEYADRETGLEENWTGESVSRFTYCPEFNLGKMSDFLYHWTPAKGRTDIDPSKYVPQGMTRERKQELDHMADKEYFSAVLNMTPDMRSALMTSEQERIRTFCARWPIEDIIKGVDIAKEGFFFTGNADRVECAFCRGVLRNWERGDDPRTLHKDNFTYCNFAQGRESSNILAREGFLMRNTQSIYGAGRSNQRAGDLLINTSLPDNVQFAVENVRKKSFVNFPSHCPVNPADLAQAGFYYAGDGDRVKCFFCGGILGSWTSGDQPWVRHVKCFPWCPFIIPQKGCNWKGMSRKRRYEDQSDPDHIDAAIKRTLAMQHMFSECEQEEIGTSITSGCMEDIKDVINIEEVCPITGQDNSAADEQRSFDVQDIDTSLTDCMQSMNLRDIISNPNEPSIEESSWLIEQSRCRTCRKNQVGSVILPCGCFVLCQFCAELERLPRKCPKCSGVVRGAVRTTLA